MISDLQDTITKLLYTLSSLKLKDTYIVVPAAGMSIITGRDYWEALYAADTLKYRWSDMEHPDPYLAKEAHLNLLHSYFVVDTNTWEIVGEFTLDTFSGKAAQIHFSLLPDLPTKTKLQICDKVGNHLLYYWRDLNDPEEVFLDTILGVTPVSNRVACIFIQKVGFTKIGVLHSGAKYLNKVDDALLTQQIRN